MPLHRRLYVRSESKGFCALVVEAGGHRIGAFQSYSAHYINNPNEVAVLKKAIEHAGSNARYACGSLDVVTIFVTR